MAFLWEVQLTFQILWENNKNPPSIPCPNDGKSAWGINSSRPVKNNNASCWLKAFPKLNKVSVDDEKKPSSKSPGHQDSSQPSTDLQEIDSDIFFVEIDEPVTESGPAVDLDFLQDSGDNANFETAVPATTGKQFANVVS